MDKTTDTASCPPDLEKIRASHRLFHSFCIKPDLKFETQGEEEEIILVLRTHPFTQIVWVIHSFIGLAILFILNIFLPSVFNVIQIVFIDLFITVCVFSYVWFNILSWFFNIGVITTERVLDVDFHGAIYKEITAANLEKIEDVTEKSGGFFESFFDYGNIFVQTAGTEQNIEFISVPRPAEIVKIINQLVHHGSV